MAVSILDRQFYEVPKVEFEPAQFFTDDELFATAQVEGATLIFDIECYFNYFLIAFKCPVTQKCVTFVRDENYDFNNEKLSWVVNSFLIVGFNSINYDLPVLWAALHGLRNDALKALSDTIIKSERTPRVGDLEVQFGFKCGYSNHIDISEVTYAPGRNGLKLFGARRHTRVLQELPYEPDTILNLEQKQFIYLYCLNDLQMTQDTYEDLKDAIQLRERMSLRYGFDLRSKSEAQVAEAVILNECESLTGKRARRVRGNLERLIRYQTPDWMKFESPQLKLLLQTVQNTKFQVWATGKFTVPDSISNLKLVIGKTKYKLGVGGLHSQESAMTYYSDASCQLLDYDVDSYYPRIIINSGLYPKQIGPEFLSVYEDIVDRRIEAKVEAGDESLPDDQRAAAKGVADALKICVNGSFGKLGSPYSALYAPELMLQVTLTGQLALLMLIERAEHFKIPIVSANTDGVVAYCPVEQQQLYQWLVDGWQAETGFTTSKTVYRSLHSANVNSYVAITEKGKVKTKGTFVCKHTMEDVIRQSMLKTPMFDICPEAVVKFLKDGIPIEDTIKACKDVTKFVKVMKISKGKTGGQPGAQKHGTYLGKIVRWYIGKNEFGPITRCNNGNILPDSTGGVPLMVYDGFPKGVDRKWYVRRAYDLLRSTGWTDDGLIQRDLFQ